MIYTITKHSLLFIMLRNLRKFARSENDICIWLLIKCVYRVHFVGTWWNLHVTCVFLGFFLLVYSGGVPIKSCR